MLRTERLEAGCVYVNLYERHALRAVRCPVGVPPHRRCDCPPPARTRGGLTAEPANRIRAPNEPAPAQGPVGRTPRKVVRQAAGGGRGLLFRFARRNRRPSWPQRRGEDDDDQHGFGRPRTDRGAHRDQRDRPARRPQRRARQDQLRRRLCAAAGQPYRRAEPARLRQDLRHRQGRTPDRGTAENLRLVEVSANQGGRAVLGRADAPDAGQGNAEQT